MVTSRGLSPLARRYLDAQLAGDRGAALRLVLDEGLAGGMQVPEIHTGVIAAAQREVGRLWEQNRISTAQEHVATAISQLALAQLYPHLPRAARTGKSALVACVVGELHDMPARIVSDFLDMSGFDVRFLGADVPTENLVACVRSESPDLVALSATMSFHFEALREAVAAVRATPEGARVPVLVGGYGLDLRPTGLEPLDVHTVDGDARALVAEARRLVGVAS